MATSKIISNVVNNQQLKTLYSSIMRESAWLNENQTRTISIDGSWHMPSANRNAFQEYQNCHIPKARFFDIDQIADQNTTLPHMLPTDADFNRHMARLGISESDSVAIYDSVGIFSACRVYWTFLIMGHKNVGVLNGGLPHWKDQNLPTESNMLTSFLPRTYKANFKAELLATYEDVLEISEGENSQDRVIVDARPAGRFQGKDPEPRAGLACGSIPGSINVPFKDVLDQQGRHFLPQSELQDIFSKARLDLSKPIVASCGSGITACVLFTALKLCGANNVSVYDGSWTEYAQRRHQNVKDFTKRQ